MEEAIRHLVAANAAREAAQSLLVKLRIDPEQNPDQILYDAMRAEEDWRAVQESASDLVKLKEQDADLIRNALNILGRIRNRDDLTIADLADSRIMIDDLRINGESALANARELASMWKGEGHGE